MTRTRPSRRRWRCDGVIQNIQILRFAAALWVVMFHALVPLVVPQAWQPALPAALEALCRLGYAGVDLFFVISGAVIAQATRGVTPGLAAARRFIAVRLARIYLGWWPFFGLFIAAMAWWGWPLAEKRFIASFLLVPVADITRYVLVLLWTLTMEVYFYLVVGALLLLARPRMRQAMLAWAALVLVVVLVNVGTGRYALVHEQGLGIFRLFIASPFVLEFIAGFLLCEWLHARPRQSLMPWALLALVCGTAAAWTHFRGGLGFFGLADIAHAPLRTLLFGGMAVGLAACAILARPAAGRMMLGLARLGDASYALYLSHILTLTSLYLLVAAWAPAEGLRGALWALALAAAVGLAALHYRWIERPLYLGAKRRIENALA